MLILAADELGPLFARMTANQRLKVRVQLNAVLLEVQVKFICAENLLDVGVRDLLAWQLGLDKSCSKRREEAVGWGRSQAGHWRQKETYAPVFFVFYLGNLGKLVIIVVTIEERFSTENHS